MVTSAVENSALRRTVDKVRGLMQYPPSYGTMDEPCSGDITCPTCRGTGRIPRGHEDQLVAVIPCNDKRLKPSRTKLYVCISTTLCLLISCLVLFFLFPRSVTLTPVSLLSATVFFTNKTVEMEITNVFNITNGNFVPVHIVELKLKGLILDTIVGNTTLKNSTLINSQSQKSYKILTNLSIKDPGLNTYCKTSFRIHTIFVALQMTLNISYLSHMEQLSLETYEYVDCGTNSTVPHPISADVIK
ncbi:transmembrane protein 106A [Boleophthalmus pectinirostris]|uniref:transmembrane protein 106A n=1 Tax=Boleophthalmus pectinirostris TaxID=150288 RepID=UPI000A1C27B1|nr:transmembrane protein 106A [Boleophthalmus pectinirostris]